MSNLKSQISDALKTAMRAKEMTTVSIIRSVMAAIKQIEIDKRIELTDAEVLAVIEKQIKQRKESVAAFEQAARADLVAKEQSEIEVISQFLPEAMTEQALDDLIQQQIDALGATSIKDMGKVMNSLRPIIAGRADTAIASSKVKAKLS